MLHIWATNVYCNIGVVIFCNYREVLEIPTIIRTTYGCAIIGIVVDFLSLSKIS